MSLWAARVSPLALAMGMTACATSSGDASNPISGQTGSPVYDSPQPREPEGGGSNGEGGPALGDSVPEMLPQPPPSPGEGVVLGTTLLVAGQQGLSLYDVSTPRQPLGLARLALEGHASLVAAESLSRIVLTVVGPSRFSAETIPTEPVPLQQARLIEVDASDPAAPSIVASAVLPPDAVSVVAQPDGYALLGGRVQPREQSCGGLEIGIAYGPRPVVSLSATRLTRQGDELVVTGERQLAPGQWHVVSDGTQVARAVLPAEPTPSTLVQLEVLDLSTLETRLELELSWQELGSPTSMRVEHQAGVLLVAGGDRLLAFELATGQALAPLTSATPLLSLSPLPDGELIALGNAQHPLARVDRATTPPTLSFVPVASGAPRGALEPFGQGFVALGPEGSAAAPRLVAETYTLSSGGELVLGSSLQTEWLYRGGDSLGRQLGKPWSVDPERQRIAYSMPVDDVEAGRLGLIELVAGELVASALVDTPVVTPGAWIEDDAALALGQGQLQVVEIETSATGPVLAVGERISIAPRNVRAQLEHAGQVWTVHRQDTGETSLSVQGGDFAEPTWLELPHAVEHLVPLSDTHLAVLGISQSGQCDTLRELPEPFAECPDQGNGVSVVSSEGSGARVVESFSLGSFIEGRPPAGVEQSLNFAGYFRLEPGKLALLARFTESCGSLETCEMLGVPAYTSYGAGGCSSAAEQCDTSVREFVSGARFETRLFELDASSPNEPRLQPSVRGGGRHSLYEAPGGDLGHQLLLPRGDRAIWAYPVEENLYDAAGESLRDAQGHALSRWHLQIIRYEQGALSFDPLVNVPGRAVALLDAAGTRLASLQALYDAEDRQEMLLHVLELRDGNAVLQHSLEVGEYVDAQRGSDGLVPLLRTPGDFCITEGDYELVVADLRGNEPRLSSPLVLAGPPEYGWGFSPFHPASSEPGIAYLFGGPASGGRLSFDLTSDPPRVVRYEVAR